MENLLKPSEAGERLKVSAKTITRMVIRGDLKGVDVGLGKRRGRIRVIESSVDAFIRRAAL